MNDIAVVFRSVKFYCGSTVYDVMATPTEKRKLRSQGLIESGASAASVKKGTEALCKKERSKENLMIDAVENGLNDNTKSVEAKAQSHSSSGDVTKSVRPKKRVLRTRKTAAVPAEKMEPKDKEISVDEAPLQKLPPVPSRLGKALEKMPSVEGPLQKLPSLKTHLGRPVTKGALYEKETESLAVLVPVRVPVAVDPVKEKLCRPPRGMFLEPVDPECMESSQRLHACMVALWNTICAILVRCFLIFSFDIFNIHEL